MTSFKSHIKSKCFVYKIKDTEEFANENRATEFIWNKYTVEGREEYCVGKKWHIIHALR